jgi:xylan 1,4-beta-xylosidase
MKHALAGPSRALALVAGGALAAAAAVPVLAQGKPAYKDPSRHASPRIAAFRNPVLPGFYPDPSVVRVGDWFYLVNSSFEMFPGVPIHRSRDLVHWEPLGHVLTRDSQLPLATAGPSRGIFAPTIRHHRGTFYMVTTNVSGGGNFFVTATDPAGPWSEPVWIQEQGGIDPSLFFDDDGTVYLTTTGGPPPGPNEDGIWQSVIDVATGKLREPPRLVWKGTGGRYPEGPHLYRIHGRYYLLISEGGTEYGHMVTVARSNSPWGPFEACPRNPILTHRNTKLDEPIQGTGHPDLVQDAEGGWWMVFLAFRPVGGWYWHHLGRETFLAPVTWEADGWPVVNEGRSIPQEMTVRGLPEHPVPPVPVREAFDGPLGPAWNHLRNPVRESYSVSERPGWLTLHGTALTLSDAGSPTFVGRRQQHLRARMATRLDFVPSREGEEAGIVLYRHPEHRYELGVRAGKGGREVFVRQTIGSRLSAVTATAPAPGREPLVLQVDAEPEDYALSWGPSPDRLARLDGARARYLSSEVAGGFIGTYVGLFATGRGRAAQAPAAFDWFDYEETAAPKR